MFVGSDAISANKLLKTCFNLAPEMKTIFDKFFIVDGGIEALAMEQCRTLSLEELITLDDPKDFNETLGRADSLSDMSKILLSMHKAIYDLTDKNDLLRDMQKFLEASLLVQQPMMNELRSLHAFPDMRQNT